MNITFPNIIIFSYNFISVLTRYSSSVSGYGTSRSILLCVEAQCKRSICIVFLSSYVQHQHNTALTVTSYFLSQLLATYVSSHLPLITFLVGLDVVPWVWSIFQALLPPPPPPFRLC